MATHDRKFAILADQQIRLRDGIVTRADVFLPLENETTAGRWPVVLERTPYDKRERGLVSTAAKFARAGYAVVLQDVRGRFASDGDWYKARDEAPDGFDTVEWIASQPWCDGRVSTIGLSYSTCTQASLACLGPKALHSQFLSQGIGTYYRAAARHGGALALRQVLYLIRQATSSREARAEPAIADELNRALEHPEDWLRAYPIRKGASPLRLVPSYEQYMVDLQTNGDFNEWWKTPGHSPMLYLDSYPDIPLYYLAGWFDHHALTQTETYATLANRNKQPLRLIIGPWLHGVVAVGATIAGDIDFGAAAAIDYDDLRLKWFDQVVKGEHTGILDGPPIRLFVMGSGDGHITHEGRIFHGGHWREESKWPVPGVEFCPFYLRGTGELSTNLPLPGEAEHTSYLYDPQDPVPSIGGNFGPNDKMTPGGMFDQRAHKGRFLGCKDNLPLSNRRDVLVFQTEPLDRDTTLIGPIAVELFVSSDCPDTDFTAKLIDVYPPGKSLPTGAALNLCDDIIRARYHDSFESPSFLEPGRVYKAKIELPPTANVFKKGHRIRIDISSSNFPRFDPNPNTGEPQGLQRNSSRARNTVHHSGRYPSRVILPLERA